MLNDPRGKHYIQIIYGHPIPQKQNDLIRQIKYEYSKHMHNNKQIEQLKINLTDKSKFNEFIKYINNSIYWADTMAVQKLSELLNIHFIIFDSTYNRLDCLFRNIDNKKNYNGYILIWWTSPVHYELITYNGRGFFTFDILPPLIKSIVDNNAKINPNCNSDNRFPIPIH